MTRLGTLEFMGPEVLRCLPKADPFQHKDRKDLAYGPAVDIWALGCVVFECIHGTPLFPEGADKADIASAEGECRVAIASEGKPARGQPACPPHPDL